MLIPNVDFANGLRYKYPTHTSALINNYFEFRLSDGEGVIDHGIAGGYTFFDIMIIPVRSHSPSSIISKIKLTVSIPYRTVDFLPFFKIIYHSFSQTERFLFFRLFLGKRLSQRT